MSPARLLAPVSMLALISAVPALAASFTVSTPTNSPQTGLTAGDTGTVTSGGTIVIPSGDAISGTGAASISNAGTVSTSTSNSAAIEINGNVTGSIVNSGTLQSGIYNTVYIHGNLGSFSNSGSITAESDQTVRVTGTTTSFSNTNTISNSSETGVAFGGLVTSFNNSGDITSLGSTVVFGGGAGTVVNTGRIVETGSTGSTSAMILRGAVAGNVQNGGVIQGVNGIYFDDTATVASTVTNSGVIKATGAGALAIRLTTAGDVLTLVTGSETTGRVDGRAGSDQLNLTGTTTGTFAMGQLDNFETIAKSDSGSWTLNGDNSTAMQAAISAGLLSVNGNLASTDVTLTGGTLAGTGRVGNVTLGSGSAISPGNNSIDTFTVADIVFSSGSVYQLDVLGKTSDKIVATGTLTFPAGATVNINGATCGINTYTIITANGGFAGGTNAGNFSATGTASPTQFSIVGNDVLLTIDGGIGRLFTGYTNTTNQAATAAALDALGCSNQPYAAQLAALTDAQVPAAMDALSGEGHAAIAASMVQNAVPVSGAASARIDEVFAAAKGDVIASGGDAVASLLDPGVFEGLDVWASGYGSVMQQASNGNAAAAQSTTGGLLFGTDRKLTEEWIGGLLSGFGVTGIQAGATSGQSLDATVGAYAGGQLGVVTVKAGAAYTRHFISTARSIVFPGVNDTVTASYQAGTAQGFLEIGTDIAAGATTITPFGKLEGVSHATDAFTETGGQGALATAASVANALFVTIGVGAEQSFVLDDDMVVKARGSIGWRHAFANQVNVANSFAGGGPFTIASAGIAGDVIVVGAGASVDIDERTSLDVSFEGAFGSGVTSGAVKVTLSGRF